MIYNKKTPFEPTTPVSPEKLTGREEIIEDYIRYIELASIGKPQHLYLNGNQCVGKSSLAIYLQEYAKVRYNMIGVHVDNKGIHTIDELINNIVGQLLNEIKSESWGKKIINGFKNNIQGFGFLENSIQFKATDKQLTQDIKDTFASFLVDLIDNFEDKDGLFIVIDDIDGLSETPDFSKWYKSFADTLSTNFKRPIPLVIMLTSHPKVVKALYKYNPSFNRNFIYRPIDSLKIDDVKSFFIKNFNSLGIDIEDDALDLMAEFTAGSPTMMQTIGDEVNLVNSNKKIDADIAIKALKEQVRKLNIVIFTQYLQILISMKMILKY